MTEDGDADPVACVGAMRTGRPSDGLDENGFRPKHILPKPESGVVLYFILDNRVAFGVLLLLESFAGLVVSDVASCCRTRQLATLSPQNRRVVRLAARQLERA